MGHPAFQNQFSMRCPECKRTGGIDVRALVYVRLVRDGTDADASRNGDHEWDAESAASCACGFDGKARDFSTFQCRSCFKIWNTGEIFKITPEDPDHAGQGDTEPAGECPACAGLCRQLQDSEQIPSGQEEDGT